jgi:hypothetical protein
MQAHGHVHAQRLWIAADMREHAHRIRQVDIADHVWRHPGLRRDVDDRPAIERAVRGQRDIGDALRLTSRADARFRKQRLAAIFTALSDQVDARAVRSQVVRRQAGIRLWNDGCLEFHV